jgi:ABC-2 type transport system permease protein
VRALMKLSWVEMKLFAREPLTVAFTFALPLVFLVVMAGVFGNEPETLEETGEPVWRGVGPTDYYVPAYVGLVMAAIGLIAVPVHIAAYREQGILRRLRASSLSIATIIGSQVIVGVVTATLAGAVLVVATFGIYGAGAPEAPAQVLLAFAVSVVSFSALGVLLGSVLPNARAGQGAGLLLFFVMMMLAGAGPPPEVMTEPMRIVGDLTPLRYVIIILQDAWLGFGWDGAAYLIVTGVLVVSSAISLVVFRWE